MKAVPSALRTEINITPLIDIVLVLLIVFIVMVPALTHAQRATAAGGGAPGTVLKVPQISVLGGGLFRWEKEELGGAALVERMAATLATQPVQERKVTLRIPPTMALGTASEAMDLVHLAASRLGEAKEVRTVLIEEQSPKP